MNSALPTPVPNMATVDRRAVVSGTDTSGPVPVEYKFRPADGDARHLIVIFSGFNAPNGYHFAGRSLNDLRANILWIRDHFDEHYSYYMCRDMSFDIEFSVLNLIDRTLAGLGLTRDQASLLGVSKGGSAALYYGLKHGFRNIVTVVPQFLIGDYVRDRAVTGRYMMGTDMPQQHVDALNGAITEQLKAYGAQGHNVYLFTSEADEQYETEINPHLNLFWNCANFNLIRTNSPMVRQHGEVSGYNLPIISGVLAALTDGAQPRIGFLENGDQAVDEHGRHHFLAELRRSETLLAVLQKQDIRGNNLQLSGHAFIPGDAGYGPVQTVKQLVLESGGRVLEFPLAATEAKYTYSRYYDRYACDYPDAGFEPENKAGIPLNGIPGGSYELSVRVSSPAEGIDRRTPLVAQRPFDLRRPTGGIEVCLVGDEQGVRLIRRPIVGHSSQETAFSMEKSWQKERIFHVEGVFFVHGLEAAERGHSTYYLVLRNARATYSYRLGISRKAPVVRPHVRRGDYGNYEFGYFATSGYKGIDLKNAATGEYEVHISMSRGGSLFSVAAGAITLA
ncbi:accessory Sec system protein Asp2 [Saccharothrix sp. ST-888]|uniref:accessory Sec system protein Asp2 n=1 Tax=Saccharothrix sp. ST-888 TaxID=1427391 RepID=UPI0005ECF658|nr:accessory Sec system protein Asp2 [Saccharothrix sp. ST-888]